MKNHESKQARWLLDGIETRLIAEYERTQLPDGKTFANVVGEYEAIEMSPRVRRQRSILIALFIAMSTALGLLIAMSTKLVPAYCVYLIPIMLWGLFWYLQRVDERCVRDARTINNCETRFEALSSTMNKLNPTGITVRMYDGARIRSLLVMLAVRVLDAEIKFDKSRLLTERRTFDVLHHGNFLEKSEGEFAQALETVNSVFGLNYKRADLFSDAGAHFQS